MHERLSLCKVAKLQSLQVAHKTVILFRVINLSTVLIHDIQSSIHFHTSNLTFTGALRNNNNKKKYELSVAWQLSW